MSFLFDEIPISKITSKNRFVRSATWEVRANSKGEVTDDLIHFLVTLAKGGVGLIIMGHAYVQVNGQGTPRQTGIYCDELVHGLREVPKALRPYGCKVVIQLSHAGGHTKSIWNKGNLVSSSPYKNIYDEFAREMTINEIREMIAAFSSAARRAMAAGFDAVQLHAAHGYLINQFLSPIWNRRKDKYGGSLRNRSRFLLDVSSSILKEVGDDFPLLVKLTSEDFIKGGVTPKEMSWVARAITGEGVAGIEVSGGSRYSGELSHIRTKCSTREEEAWFAENAQIIRERIDVPLALVGGIRSVETAEELVKKGRCDLISLSRPLICEPDLINRWKSGDRRKAKCTCDNRCFGPAYDGLGLWCETFKAKKYSRSRLSKNDLPTTD